MGAGSHERLDRILSDWLRDRAEGKEPPRASYMSPEQAMAMREDIDARTDVYSLGATLYEALTLRPPMEGEDPVSLISRIITEEPPRPRRLRDDIPKDLETITLRAMAKGRRRLRAGRAVSPVQRPGRDAGRVGPRAAHPVSRRRPSAPPMRRRSVPPKRID